METLIGYDNTETFNNAEIFLTTDESEESGFIGCPAYDWAYDVTAEQINKIKSGKVKDILAELTSSNVDWFNAV